jgi:uncharacterized protein YjiS (DUF1127 family)
MLPLTITHERPWPYRSSMQRVVGSARRGRPVAALARLIAAVLREHRARRTMRQLMELNNHLLRDIGLSRGEIGAIAEFGG